jgi:hypothetical protein
MRIRQLGVAALGFAIVFAACYPEAEEQAVVEEEVPSQSVQEDPISSAEAMIKNALSAGPEDLVANATVVDLEGNVLREGTNEYTCMPDDPEVSGNSPMCADETWLAWIAALMSQQPPPKVEKVSFAYMLQGDWPTSNTDPFATGPTEDNEWAEDIGPHIMVLVPDIAILDGVSDDHDHGAPYVMWKGTEYEHLMIPAAKKE